MLKLISSFSYFLFKLNINYINIFNFFIFYNLISYTFSTNLLSNMKLNPTLPQILVKKNYKYFQHKIKIYKIKLKYKNFLFCCSFKFNKYFKWLTLSKHLINLKKTQQFKKIKTKTNYLVFFWKFYAHVMKKNWHFVIGKFLTPNKTLINDKNIFKTKIFKLTKNKFKLWDKLKETQKNFFLKKKFDNRTFLKKIYLNNFFYLNNLNLNFHNFFSIFKNTSKLNKKYLKSLKPYMYLNSSVINKANMRFNSSWLLKLYKNYRKIFNIFKKIRYKFKTNKFQFFKIFNFNKKNLFNLSFSPFKLRQFKSKHKKIFCWFKLKNNFNLFKYKQLYFSNWLKKKKKIRLLIIYFTIN